MRKFINNRYTKLALGLVAIALVCALPALGFAALLGGTGLTYAASLSGPLSVDKIDTDNPEHLMKSMSKFITEIKPSEYALDTMIRNIGKKDTAIRPKHDYEEVTYRPWSAAVNGGGFTAAGSAADEEAEIPVDNPEMFEIGTTVRLDGIAGASSQDQRALVIDKGASSITVTGINSSTGQRIPTVAASTTVYRMGAALNELDAQIASNLQNPAEDFNYCQLHMAMMERSEMEQYTKSYSGYDYADRKRIALYDFRSEIEQTSFFGVKSVTNKTVDGETKKVYTADGVIPKISQTINFGTGSGAVDPSLADIIDIGEQVFAPNAGSEVRCLFAGRKLIAGLDKIAYDRNLTRYDKEVYQGVKCSMLVSSFGEIYVKHSKTLDQQGWQNKGVILDLDHVVRAELEPLKATPLDLNKAGVRRTTDAIRITENTCLTTRYSGAGGVHAILEPTA